MWVLRCGEQGRLLVAPRLLKQVRRCSFVELRSDFISFFAKCALVAAARSTCWLEGAAAESICLSEGSKAQGSSPLAGEKPDGAEMSEEDALISSSRLFSIVSASMSVMRAALRWLFLCLECYCFLT